MPDARKVTIKIRRHSGSLPSWWAHISIPHPENDLLAYEIALCALTRKRVVAKAERHVRRHYADAAAGETLSVEVPRA